MDNQSKVMNNDSYEDSKKAKALFYTIAIFSIIVLGWFYTSPLFNKKDSNPDKGSPISPEMSEKVNSIGQSFNVMWSNITNK